jgi:hypothetical protein
VRNAYACPNVISRECVYLCNCPTFEATPRKCPFSDEKIPSVLGGVFPPMYMETDGSRRFGRCRPANACQRHSDSRSFTESRNFLLSQHMQVPSGTENAYSLRGRGRTLLKSIRPLVAPSPAILYKINCLYERYLFRRRRELFRSNETHTRLGQLSRSLYS